MCEEKEEGEQRLPISASVISFYGKTSDVSCVRHGAQASSVPSVDHFLCHFPATVSVLDMKSECALLRGDFQRPILAGG